MGTVHTSTGLDAGAGRARLLARLACVTLSAFVLSLQTGAVQARATHGAGAASATPRTPEAREVFAEQMSGAPSPDDLGSTLPPGIMASAVARLVVPVADTGAVGMVGLKPWAARTGSFVALVCTGGNGPSKVKADGCSGGGSSAPLHAYVALVMIDGAGRPKLVTRPIEVEANVDWDRSLLPSRPEAAEDSVSNGGHAAPPSAYDRLDLAPYRIAPGVTAFGIRASWSDGYAGGFGWHSATLLYAVIDGQLRQVLAVPTIALTFLAGDWHRNGMRDHEIDDGANVIVVTETLNAGHADVIVRSRIKWGERLFRWDAASMRYKELSERVQAPKSR